MEGAYHIQMANVFGVPVVLQCSTRLAIPTIKRASHEPLFVKKSRVSKLESRFLSKHRLLVEPSNCDNNAKISTQPEDEEYPALETVLELHSAINNQNIDQVSSIIGDECRCVCNFFSFFQSFQGKQQVLDFLNYVMEMLGDNIEFVVKPTLHDGMNVGVSWRLQWCKTHMPLGKGFSFYICQIYQGKVTIRNVEMFMEPLLHIGPLRMKIIGYLMNASEKINSLFKLTPNNMKQAVLLMSIILLFMKPGLY
ncbi:uncharacterized protein LOC126664068 [Mercurialis annua]|uniref:uncharacterized protein LOC126664068 n=1 Tax=Mercurialis annua TaxID=3986 RepID=UPI00215ECAA5|nr:uncharacterized protein LOC126664068 [Mercurialis annua]